MPVTGDRPIRAVILDVGGILEPLVDEVLVRELAEMLETSTERLRERRTAEAIALAEGRLTLRDFYARLVTDGGGPADPDLVVSRHLAVYRAAATPVDARVLGLIRDLRRHHVVACLSNTEVEIARLNRERGLFRPFDRAFLSTELGLHKPDRAIFARVLEELGCAASEAVFTDDNLENTLGARAVGMHAIHYRDFEGFSRQLARLVPSAA
jgi:HAD superfamily hydrolase (TIGR01509 family)